ncbi:unnamed protein product [Somion occarium]|uniref:PEBP-like protein n=1 Tax=Somion occarium TaxID=3059160 RepID=A0ABP1D794_9APHY
MISLSFILSLALVPLAFAQNNTQLQIEAIEAHFSNSGQITPGQALDKSQVAPAPSVLITPANSTVSLEGTFTLAMIDADIVGADQSEGQTRHWLVNSVTLTGTTPLNVSTEGATVITSYAGPGPAAGSGAHRYVVLLYSQPSTFTAPEGLNAPGAAVEKYNFDDYVKNSNLGPLVAGTYFTVEEGTASATVSSTAAVVTSTLPVATASGTSGSTSGSGSGAPSPTSTGSSQSNGAKGSKVFSVEVLLIAFALGFFLG